MKKGVSPKKEVFSESKKPKKKTSYNKRSAVKKSNVKDTKKKSASAKISKKTTRKPLNPGKKKISQGMRQKKIPKKKPEEEYLKTRTTKKSEKETGLKAKKKPIKKKGRVKPIKKALLKKSQRLKKKSKKLSEKIPKIKEKQKEPVVRHENNPIISPNPENEWEAGQTFNPAAIQLEDGKIHFLYRAVGRDGFSRLGYASSKDGSNIWERLLKPVYEHLKADKKYTYYSFASGGSWGGCEDPRLVRVGDEDRLFLIYTACDEGLRIGLSSIKVEDFLNKKWKWSKPKLISPSGEVHKNWVIFPEKINGKYAILHSINPEVAVEYVDSLDFKEGEHIRSQFKQKEVKKGRWDSKRRGVGPIPIKTEEGWLVFYHAEDHRDPGKYKIGAMLLDLDNPEKVLHRSKVPIIEPKEIYEMEGAKQGVVYTLGSVVRDDGRLFVFYGGADNYVCVASADLDEFLKAVKKGNRKPLKFLGFLKRKKKKGKKKKRK